MRRELPRPAIYLDRSLFGAAVSEAMRPRDRAALCRIAAMVAEDLITFFAPASARTDIDAIAPAARRHYAREAAALDVLRAAPAGWIDAEPGAGDEALTALRRIMGDDVDAAVLFRARLTGVRDIITTESSVLFERARELVSELELRVFRPADYLSRWSTQLQLPR